MVLLRSGRDTNEKESISISSVVDMVSSSLKLIQSNLFDQANQFMKENIYSAKDYSEFKEIINKGI